MKAMLAYTIVLLALLACDFVWLSLTGETLYRPAMGTLERAQPNMIAAAGFYLIYALGLSVLVINPAMDTDGPVNRLDMTWKALVFGLAAFATYDLTGLAVIRNWPPALSVIDMGWGVVNATISTNLTLFILRLLGQVRGA